MSQNLLQETLPPEYVRWFYGRGTHRDDSWKAFSGADSLKLETAFRNGSSSNDQKVVVRGDLFEVDLQTFLCSPIYWPGEKKSVHGRKYNWCTTPVHRGIWFYKINWTPIDGSLATAIENEHLLRALPKLREAVNAKKGKHYTVHKFSHNNFNVMWMANGEVFLITRSARPFGKVTLHGDLSSMPIDRGYSHPSDISDAPPPITHLCFVIHGIGQQLASIRHECSKIREMCKRVAKKYYPKLRSAGLRLEFIPVDWRSSLDLNACTLENITVGQMRPLRMYVNLCLIDILYYATPFYREEIMQSLSWELTRLYNLFIKNNPFFLQRGGQVSVLAHSLGTVVMHDILTRNQNNMSSRCYDSTNTTRCSSPRGSVQRDSAQPSNRNRNRHSDKCQSTLLASTHFMPVHHPWKSVQDLTEYGDRNSSFVDTANQDGTVRPESSWASNSAPNSPPSIITRETSNDSITSDADVVAPNSDTSGVGSMHFFVSPDSTDHSSNPLSIASFLSRIRKPLSWKPLPQLANLFLVGSPLGLFVSLTYAPDKPIRLRPPESQSPTSRYVYPSRKQRHKTGLVRDDDTSTMRRESGAFNFNETDPEILFPYKACRRVYNIFHSYDPVAYRLEPLLLRHYSAVCPVVLPSPEVFLSKSRSKNTKGAFADAVSVNSRQLSCVDLTARMAAESNEDGSLYGAEFGSPPAQPHNGADLSESNSDESGDDDASEITSAPQSVSIFKRLSVTGNSPIYKQHKSKTMEFLTKYITRRSSHVTNLGPLTPMLHSEPQNGEKRLNYRVDYEWQKSFSPLAILGAHQSYWRSQEIAFFILYQTFGHPDSIG
ncbi:unnamed protein product [Calicophoron daubneyi]|uniref:DDHD domain-containing protein n=1 Tax=Calicophoron daubneyi TaxID=300641 RepID=A0AAV2TQM4_CALDB